MISSFEKQKMLAVPGCGKRTVELLDKIGARRLSDLGRETPLVLMRKIELSTGYPRGRSGRLMTALSNLVKAAREEGNLSEREKMLRVPLCGERVIERLKSIGIEKLADLKGKNAHILMHQINLEAGRVIWRPPMAILALTNLIQAAELDDSEPTARK